MSNKLSYLFNNPDTGRPSITRTAFTTGFLIASLKLLLSGVQITDTYKFPEFDGADFAVVVGACGGIYSLSKRKNVVESDLDNEK